MKKEYSVAVTKNGFIIRLDHIDLSFREENQYVALTLNQVIKIIKKDISNRAEKDLLKTGSGEETKEL